MIAAICGFLSCCVLLSHIFPVFLVMTLPRPINTSLISNSSNISSDNPPGYDTLMASQLPGYDDSIVQKTQVSYYFLPMKNLLKGGCHYGATKGEIGLLVDQPGSLNIIHQFGSLNSTPLINGMETVTDGYIWILI